MTVGILASDRIRDTSACTVYQRPAPELMVDSSPPSMNSSGTATIAASIVRRSSSGSSALGSAAALATTARPSNGHSRHAFHRSPSFGNILFVGSFGLAKQATMLLTFSRHAPCPLVSPLLAIIARSDKSSAASRVGSKADIGGPPLAQFSFVSPRPSRPGSPVLRHGGPGRRRRGSGRPSRASGVRRASRL